MSQAPSPSAARPYGLARVCRVWRTARATVYRRRAPSRAEPSRRPGPVGPMPDADLVAAIRAVLAASPFHGEGHRKVWARLRHAGVRTSKRRADVVGIFPGETSIVRLIGAVLLEANDEWQLQHRYMQVEAMAELTAEPELAQIPPQAA